jgi:hypothetical protein
MMLRGIVVNDERVKREARLPRVYVLTLTNGVEGPVVATMTLETQNDQIVGPLVWDSDVVSMVRFESVVATAEGAHKPAAVLGLKTFPSPARGFQILAILGARHKNTPFVRVCSADAGRSSNSVETIDG